MPLADTVDCWLYRNNLADKCICSGSFYSGYKTMNLHCIVLPSLGHLTCDQLGLREFVDTDQLVSLGNTCHSYVRAHIFHICFARILRRNRILTLDTVHLVSVSNLFHGSYTVAAFLDSNNRRELHSVPDMRQARLSCMSFCILMLKHIDHTRCDRNSVCNRTTTYSDHSSSDRRIIPCLGQVESTFVPSIDCNNFAALHCLGSK